MGVTNITLFASCKNIFKKTLNKLSPGVLDSVPNAVCLLEWPQPKWSCQEAFVLRVGTHLPRPSLAEPTGSPGTRVSLAGCVPTQTCCWDSPCPPPCPLGTMTMAMAISMRPTQAQLWSPFYIRWLHLQVDQPVLSGIRSCDALKTSLHHPHGLK